MVQPVDIVVHAPNGAAAAAVEVKNVRYLDLAHAREMREMLLSEGAVPAGAFLIILSQERGYLWAPGGSEPREFPMQAVTATYGRSLLRADPAVWLRGAEVEMIVTHWLMELAAGLPRAQRAVVDSGLADTGLSEAVRDGQLWNRAA